jgi:hypothetical protein
MRFDLQKIDERIKKLQEIRRLATDPEAASLLVEFISPAAEPLDPAPAAQPQAVSVTNHSTDAVVKEVVNAKEAGFGSGIWTRARG